MNDIFQLLSNLLTREVTAYRNHLGANQQANGAYEQIIRLHCRLARSVLAVFQVLVDWVSIQFGKCRIFYFAMHAIHV